MLHSILYFWKRRWKGLTKVSLKLLLKWTVLLRLFIFNEYLKDNLVKKAINSSERYLEIIVFKIKVYKTNSCINSLVETVHSNENRFKTLHSNEHDLKIYSFEWIVATKVKLKMFIRMKTIFKTLHSNEHDLKIYSFEWIVATKVQLKMFIPIKTIFKTLHSNEHDLKIYSFEWIVATKVQLKMFIRMKTIFKTLHLNENYSFTWKLLFKWIVVTIL